MATFFSAPGRHKDIAGGGGDMPFHHYPGSSSTAGLAPIPATAAQQGDAQNELAFMCAAEESQIETQHHQMMMQRSQAMQRRHELLSLSLATQVQASLYPHFSPTGVASRGSSRYLKAARDLLDELVSVQDAGATPTRKPDKNRSHSSGDAAGNDDDRKDPAVNSSPAGEEPSPSPSERQELENKATALQGLLDQVEQRYRGYEHEMRAVASWLDAAAGRGTARPYTAVALRTISRHFRSLRDAIAAQLRSARRSLGEPPPDVHGGIHRLRYIDQRMRRQQLGFGCVIQQQHAAWRPQRGLPEPAVSVLRAWLFEHFLHPYPKEPEKLMLARQASLTRGQVSNWFINARVRLWKPMIEEMYREEFGEEIMEANSSSEVKGKDEPEPEPARALEDLQSPSSTMQGVNPFKSTATGLDDNAAVYSSIEGLRLHQRQRQHAYDTGLLHDGAGERFLDLGGSGLTLGLHGRHDGVTLVGLGSAEQAGMDAGAFEYVDGSDDRQRFGSSSQLLHNFVT